jgi:hypothetical protein
MGRFTIRLRPRLFGLAVIATLAAATSAAAIPVSGEQFLVSGKQTLLNRKAETFEMHGGMVGSWKITSFKEVASQPVFRGKGTELFKGCVDRQLDGSCAGDPSGTMTFSFRYWAKVDKQDKVKLGTCAHPVTGGTGNFAGASGFLIMVDTPIKKAPFIKTEYEGVITLSGSLPSARLGAPASPC